MTPELYNQVRGLIEKGVKEWYSDTEYLAAERGDEIISECAAAVCQLLTTKPITITVDQLPAHKEVIEAWRQQGGLVQITDPPVIGNKAIETLLRNLIIDRTDEYYIYGPNREVIGAYSRIRHAETGMSFAGECHIKDLDAEALAPFGDRFAHALALIRARKQAIKRAFPEDAT